MAAAVSLVLPLSFEEDPAAPFAFGAAAAAAAAQGGGWDCIIVSREFDDQAGQTALRMGASTVWFCVHPDLRSNASARQVAAAALEALEQLAVSGARLWLAPATDAGEELAATIAAARGAVAVGRIHSVQPHESGVAIAREAYGTRASARIVIGGEAWGVMRSSMASAAVPAASGAMQHIRLRNTLPTDLPSRVEHHSRAHLPLEGSRIVVSGGRGVGGSDGFEQLQELAQVLGAGLGASLAAVDEGWAPISCQVGLSGKFISPQLYLAIGISGAPHHLAGLGDATRVVAINSDPQADIFRVASAGCVDDCREMLPLLIEQLRSMPPLHAAPSTT